MRRIGSDDLARHQPVKQHADAGQVLLDGRSRAHLAQLLDVPDHMHRLHVLDARDAFVLAPAQERARRLPIRRPGVLVADIHGEEFQETPGGSFACLRDERRKLRARREGNYSRFSHEWLSSQIFEMAPAPLQSVPGLRIFRYPRHGPQS